MNPVALQLTKGNPFAPTSWGAFGPGWLWVSAPEGGQIVLIGTATEVETANPITPSKPQLVSIGTAVEVELARTITPLKPINQPIGTAIERELVRSIIPRLGEPSVIGDIVCTILMPKATCLVHGPTALCAILSPSAECEII